MDSQGIEPDVEWLLVYTKPRAERWAQANLHRQGYETLFPRVLSPAGEMPLFPRYLFVGRTQNQRVDPLRSTSGVSYTVSFGDRPARVSRAVVKQLRSRMDQHGLVTLESAAPKDTLFSRRDRERVRTLLKLAAAGYRVKIA